MERKSTNALKISDPKPLDPNPKTLRPKPLNPTNPKPLNNPPRCCRNEEGIQTHFFAL